MKRVRLRIAYRGTAYHGWQRQQSVQTVEGAILDALQKILNAPSVDAIPFQGASRTDAGVHALAQTAHFDHDTSHDEWTFVRGLNALTPDDITIIRAEEVDPSFDARRSARGKIYRYQIWNHRFPHPLLLRDAWHVSRELDRDAMQEAANLLLGEHDFAGFRASDCQAATTTRHIWRMDVESEPSNPLITIWVEGDAFLKYLVRILSGTLMEVGTGRFAPEHVLEILATGDRALAGVTAPPWGLTLMKLFYPDFPWQRGEPDIGSMW